MKCKNRSGNIVYEENMQDDFLKKIYGSSFGRCVLKVLTLPFLSNLAGKFLDTKISCFLIEPFIKSNNIDMSDYVLRSYTSYNDFFTRDLVPGARLADPDKKRLVSPSDGRISVYKISEDSIFEIKNSFYSVGSILKSKKMAEKYKDGYCLIIRLCVDNYHRYSYIDNGSCGKSKKIDGVLHTVNPEALEHYNIYKENSRVCTLLHTENFGDVMQVEVGALMIGRISNYHDKGYVFYKGQEKGKFEFGGSTIVLFIEKDKIKVDEDLILNTMEGFETSIFMGNSIGTAL